MQIAIVGCSYELPKVINDTELSYVFENSVDTVTDVRVDDNNKNIVKKAYRLKNYKMFDPEFFGYSDSEIKNMDPQHRKLLENTWKTLTKYGLRNDSSILERTGVFSALSTSDYLTKNLISKGKVEYSTYINNIPDTAASKVSFKMGLGGASFNIGSACSSFGTALHFACSELDNNNLDMALVGGSRIISDSDQGYVYVPGGIFSESGVCRPFDKDADGMVPGSGVIVFALKRLKDARKENDSILAIIKAVGLANDGSKKSGFTAPGVWGQTQAMKNAYVSAHMSSSEVDYVELHGTGTKIGDAIEATSLKQVFNQDKLIVGSSKANFGHLDTASAALGILKAIWMFKHKVIPAQANYTETSDMVKKINPRIKIFDKTTKNDIHTVGVNSFGMGGTNAHIILMDDNYKPKSKFLSSKYNVPVFSRRKANHKEHVKLVKETLQRCTNDNQLRGMLRNLLYCSLEDDNCTWLTINLIHKNHVLSSVVVQSNGIFSLTDEREKNAELLKATIQPVPLERLNLRKLWVNQDDFYSENGLEHSKGDNYNNVLKIFQEYCSSMSYEDLLHCRLNNLRIDSFLLIELLNKIKKITGKVYNVTDFLNSNQTVDVFVKTATSLKSNKEDNEKELDLNSKSTPVEIVEQLQKYNSKYDLTVSLADVVKNNNDVGTVIMKYKKEKSDFDFITYLNGFYRERPDMYLIHPAGGTTMGYQHFFLDDYYPYNVVLVNFPFAHNEYIKHYDMAQLASLYKDAISSISKGRGNFIIGGYSFGGNIAFEIARQLQTDVSMSDHLKALLMIDSHPIEAYSEKAAVNKEAQDMMEREIIQNNTKGIQTANQFDKESFFESWTLNHKMLKNYSTDQVLDKKLILLICKDKENQNLMRKLHIKYLDKRRWQERFSKPISYSYIDGNHYTIYMDTKLGAKVGKVIDKYIRSLFVV